MIIAIDIETYEKQGDEYIPVLNCQSFILGAILVDKKKIEFFETPNKMSERLIDIIEKEIKRGGRVFIYAHNMAYDFIGTFSDYLKDSVVVNFSNGKQIKYFSLNPFMAMYGHDQINKYGKEQFKCQAYFLDLMSYFRGTALKEVGEFINLPKLEMPKNPKSIEEIKPYLQRDCEIVLEGIKKIKVMVNKLGFKPKRYLTAGNTAMTCFLAYARKNKLQKVFSHGGITFKGEHVMKTRPAYRGGRVECLRTGMFQDCIKIDCNSMYPYIMINMDFPYLKKEVYIEGNRAEAYLNYIGILKCTIKSPDNLKYGYLPIRFGNLTFYPKGRTLRGTWTTIEIREAIKLGYELIKVEYGIFYPKAVVNPLKEYMTTLWNLRKESVGIEKEVVKLLMNTLYGKFAQIRANNETKIIERGEFPKYKNIGYKFVKTEREKFIVMKEGEKKIPSYGNPMISTWITANARDYLYKEMMKVPQDDLLYLATDALIIKNSRKLNKEVLNIGNNIGQFKIEDTGNCKILGEGKYRFNKNIKLGGIPKKDLTDDVFEGKRKVKISKMVTIKEVINNSELQNKIGTFMTEEVQITQEGKNSVILPLEIDETKDKMEVLFIG